MSERRYSPLATLFAATFLFRIGNAVAALALPWFVLSHTKSAAWAGATAASSVIATIIGAWVGGGLVDRFGRAPEPIDEATTNPRADDGRDDAASGRGARPGRALCMRQDEPWKREGRHRVADPEEKGRREQRRERAISTFAHSAAASCAFAAARYSSLPESRAKSA